MAETVVHFQLRMPPSLHEQLASQARGQKISLNALVVGLLRGAVEEKGAQQGQVGVTAATIRDRD
jgi:predicted HicB family RNase H-like nuclease